MATYDNIYSEKSHYDGVQFKLQLTFLSKKPVLLSMKLLCFISASLFLNVLKRIRYLWNFFGWKSFELRIKLRTNLQLPKFECQFLNQEILFVFRCLLHALSESKFGSNEWHKAPIGTVWSFTKFVRNNNATSHLFSIQNFGPLLQSYSKLKLAPLRTNAKQLEFQFRREWMHLL